jgi:hypothetical protein
LNEKKELLMPPEMNQKGGNGPKECVEMGEGQIGGENIPFPLKRPMAFCCARFADKDQRNVQKKWMGKWMDGWFAFLHELNRLRPQNIP